MDKSILPDSVQPTGWAHFVSAFRHQGWGWVVSALAAFLATLAPDLVRVLCLLFAAIVATWTFHRTERINKRWKLTIPVGLGFVVVALTLFFIARYFDRHSVQAKVDTESPSSQQTPTQPTSPQSPAPQTTPPPAVAKSKTKQSATATSKGNNSPAGAINQDGNNNTAIVGSGNTVVNGPSADEIADKVAQKIGPTVKGGFHEVPDRIEVSFGSVTASSSIDLARQDTFTPFLIGDGIPVQVKIKGDHLKWSFKSWDAGLPVEVTDNDVVKIGNSSVDRNFTDTAFEIVNKDHQPLFQMIRKNAGSLQINGIFPTGRISNQTGLPLLYWISDETGITTASRRPSDWNLKPIFKYPYWKYPGVLDN